MDSVNGVVHPFLSFFLILFLTETTIALALFIITFKIWLD